MPSLRESLRRQCRWLWQRRGGIRAALGFFTPKRERVSGDGGAQARARFWDAVREGRREAEAQCSKREP